MKEPVILIPGIQGTKLTNINRKNFDTVWSGIHKFFDNLYDLILKKDGETDSSYEVIIERQDVEDIAYSEIINFLKHQGHPVYIFGYDWRKSNLDTGAQLLEFVKSVQRKHDINTKISFITHSMGCLVFSGFIRLLTDHQHDQFINKVIFTVPPFKGSIEAMFNLVIGKSKLFNSSDDFRKIARTFPAIFELCPVYDDAVAFINGNNVFNIYDYRYWQQNPSRDPNGQIKDQYEVRLEGLKKTRSHNNLLFDFSTLPRQIKDRMLVVAGVGDDTQKKMHVDDSTTTPKNKFIFYDRPPYQDKEGDGTVHLKSAEVFKTDITTLKVESQWIEKRLDGRMIMSDWHSFFLNNGRVQNIIQRFLKYDKDQRTANWYNSTGGGVDLVS